MINPYYELYDFFSPTECDNLIKLAQENEFTPSTVYAHNDPTEHVDDKVRKCDTSPLYIKDMLWLEDRLVTSLTELNYQHFTYEISSIVELQCLRYTQDSFFIPHSDLKDVDSKLQRKITFIIQLSDKDDYVGADLKLYTQLPPVSVSRQRGSLIAFPAYTLHEVTPLLSGERYVLIGWCAGPHLM